MRIHRLIERTARWVPPLLVVLLCGPAQACRYNVRDLGFIGLGDSPYHLYLCGRGQPIPVEPLHQARERFRAGNVTLDWIDVDQPEQPGHRHWADAASGAVPIAILVSPDGPVLSLDVPEGPPLEGPDWTTWLEGVLDSPWRNRLRQAAIDAFAVVLLIEGADAAANTDAQREIDAAIAALTQRLGDLPKAVANPPVRVTLPYADRARERILLWSLGLGEEPGTTARAAVIYGLARWMGPLMRPEEIREPNVFGLLSIIGEDCECGMDLGWTRGTRLPIRWESGHREAAARQLGFDPEHPMVLTEAAQILMRYAGLPPGSVMAEVAARVERVAEPGSLSAAPAPPALASAGSAAPGSAEPSRRQFLLPLLGALGLVVVGAFGGVVYLVARARRRSF